MNENLIDKNGKDTAAMDAFLRRLTFDFLGQGRHKVAYETLFSDPEGVLLDVRTREEMQSVRFTLEHQVSLSLHIPLDELPDRLEEVPRNCRVGILCVSDVRSAIAYAYLQANGFENVRVLAGGTAGLLEQLKTGMVRKQMTARQISACEAGRDS
jgi:rhodanese-related sulfurtransferase